MGNIVVNIQAKYRKDRIKTEGVYVIWKKFDGRTMGRLRAGIGSALLTMSASELKISAQVLERVNQRWFG